MKKAICVSLVVALIVLIFCGPLAQESKAFAASIAVIGAVLAVMAVCGITFAASGMTAAQIQSYIGNKLDDWATSMGQPLDHLINSAGIGMTISGLLSIGSAAASGINDFISWFCTEENIISNSNKVVVDSPTSVGGLTVARVYQYAYNMDVTGSAPFYVMEYILSNGEVFGFYTYNGVYYNIKLLSRSEFTIVRVIYKPDGSIQQTITESPSQYNANWYYSTITSIPAGSQYQNPAPPLPREPTDNLNVWPANSTVVTGSNLTVVGGTITIPHVGPTDKYFIDVAGVIPGDTVIDAADVITGGISIGVMPTVQGEVAENEPDYVITGPVEIPGLAQVFPFCLPFDVYNFLSALAADPEAPHFEWRFYVPGICDETLEIDLSAFNTVAQILRTMELLAFIVGLAFVTRSRFIRS